jgi:hypothetical protein
MHVECYPKSYQTPESKEKVKNLPSFKGDYQSWYSEARMVVKQLLPDRLSDFVRLYEKPKSRKEITSDTYRVEDYLQSLEIVAIVGPSAAIPQFRQQLAILDAVKRRFESSLFDIRQLVQADLFDSELDAARELAKHKFLRAGGAIAGVVLERHLGQVCDAHGITVSGNATIAVLNDSLKAGSVIDMPQWRFVQRLGDIRNLCDHSKTTEPTAEQIKDLVEGTEKIIKTLF